MADMIVPLLDHSKPENIERFDNFCKVFFKDYDKDDKGYIEKKDLKAPLKEIMDNFSSNSFGFYKLKLLFAIIDGKKDNALLNNLINSLNTNNLDKGVSNVASVLDVNNNNKICFNEFKEIVKLLFYCLIDQSTDEQDDNDISTDLVIIAPDNISIENILNDNENEITSDEFIYTLINDTLENFDDQIDLQDLGQAIKNTMANVCVNGNQIVVTDKMIEKLYNENNLLNVVSKSIAEKILYTFIVQLLDKN